MDFNGSRFFRWFPVDAILNVSYLTVSDFIIYFTGFLYGVLAARILGAEKFGQLVLIVAITKFLAAFFVLRLNSPLITLIRQKFEVDDRAGIRDTMFGALLLQGGAMVLFLILFLAATVGLPPYWRIFYDWQTAMVLYGISEASFNLRLVSPFLMGLEKYGWKSGWDVLESLVRNFLPVPFMFYGVQAVCLGYVVAEGVLAFVIFGAVLWRWGNVTGNLTLSPGTLREVVRELYVKGRSNYLANLSKKLWNRSFALIIGTFVGSREVAFFNIGHKFKHVLRFLANPVRNYLFPRLVDKWERNREEFFYTLRKYMYQVTPINLLGALAICATAPWFVPWVYGAAFIPSVRVIWILIPAFAVKFVFHIFWPVIFARDSVSPFWRQWLGVEWVNVQLLEVQVVKLAVGWGLVFPLTVLYGYLGTAGGLACVSVLLAIYQGWVFCRLFGWRWLLPP